MTQYQPSAVYLREYEQIFTGTNQEYGYHSPFLAFEADTSLQLLKTDEVTYFHFPDSSSITPLSASSLVFSGAIAGSIPSQADKIWKKAANYKKNIWWGNSELPQVGIWLCSWLSGAFDGDSTNVIWMDRWYNPGVIDPNTAIWSENLPAVYDEPSTMTLDPGVWYKYGHIGNNTNSSIVNDLSGESGTLRLHLDDWSSSPVDLSPYNNTTSIQKIKPNTIYPTSVDRTKADTSLFVDSGSHATVLFDESFELTDKISVAFWAKSPNWTELKGHDILSRNFRGGWEFTYNNGFYNPTFTMYDIDGNTVIGNIDGDVKFTATLPGSSTPVACEITTGIYSWIADNGLYENEKHIYKVDFNGNIEDAIYTINYRD